VTGGGGLALVAGMLLLGEVAGSYDLSVILTQRAALPAPAWYLPALHLILPGPQDPQVIRALHGHFLVE